MLRPDPRSPVSHRKPHWLFLAAIFVLCVGGFIGLVLRPQPLAPLATMLAEIGTPETMPKPAAEFFMIPGGTVPLRQVQVHSTSGRIRSAQLYAETGDIFFIEQPADNSRTNFYRTNGRGKVILGGYIDSSLELHPIENLEESFEKERDFWLTYQRERATHEAK